MRGERETERAREAEEVEGSKLNPFKDYSEEFIYCVFSIKDIWKSESYRHHSWSVLKFKKELRGRWGGSREERKVYCPF